MINQKNTDVCRYIQQYHWVKKENFVNNKKGSNIPFLFFNEKMEDERIEIKYESLNFKFGYFKFSFVFEKTF